MEGGAGVLLVLPQSTDALVALPLSDAQLFVAWFALILNVVFVGAVHARVVGVRLWHHFGPAGRRAQRAMRQRRPE